MLCVGAVAATCLSCRWRSGANASSSILCAIVFVSHAQLHPRAMYHCIRTPCANASACHAFMHFCGLVLGAVCRRHCGRMPHTLVSACCAQSLAGASACRASLHAHCVKIGARCTFHWCRKVRRRISLTFFRRGAWRLYSTRAHNHTQSHLHSARNCICILHPEFCLEHRIFM